MSGSDFVGRTGELAILDRRFEAASRGQGSITIVIGEPGVGKTALATRFSALARERGALALGGAAYEADWAPPYGPWSELLRDLARQVGRSAFLDLTEGWSGALAPLLPDRSLASNTGGPIDRAVLFQAVVDVLNSASRQVPLLLVCDDVQWADRDSVALLQWFGRSVSHARIMILLVTRPVEGDRTAALTSLIGTTRRSDPDGLIDLHPFTSSEASQFIVSRLGESDETFRQSLIAASGGNALYLSELLRDRAGTSRVTDSAAESVPAAVRDIVQARLTRLSPTARELLMVFALSRGSLPFPVIVAVLDLNEAVGLDALDEALNAFLLRTVDARTERYDVSHDIVKRAVAETISPSRQRIWHRRIAEAIEALAGERSAADLADLAFHLSHAHLDDTDRLIDLQIETARRLARQLAFEEAADHYVRALSLMPGLSADPPTGDLAGDRELAVLIELGDAYWAGGTRSAAKDAWFQAADRVRARQAGEPDEAAVRTLADILLRFRSALVDPRAPDDRLIALIEQTIALVDDRAVRARLLVRWSQELAYSFDPARQGQRRELIERALGDARASGDPRAIAAALDGSLHPHVTPPELPGTIASATEMVTIARSLADVELLMVALEWQINALVQHGDIAEASLALAEHTQLTERTRLPAYAYLDVGWRGTLATLAGQFGEALQLAGEIGQIGAQIGDENAPIYAMLQTLSVFRETGQPAELAVQAEQVALFMPDSAIFRIIAALCRDSDNSLPAVIDSVTPEDLAGLAAANAEVSCLCWLAELCTRVGARDRAEEFYQRLLPYSKVQAFVGRGLCYAGVVDRYLGLLAKVLERWEAADDHLSQAESICRVIGARPQLAHILADRADLARLRETTDSDAPGARWLEESRSIAASLGMVKLLNRLDQAGDTAHEAGRRLS